MEVIDLSYLSQAAYRLAELVTSKQYRNVWYYEIHEKIDPTGPYNCISGWESFQDRCQDLYNIFIDPYEADAAPAKISIALKVEDKWFIASNVGSNYYGGYGPTGIFKLREACSNVGIAAFCSEESFDGWCKKNIPLSKLKNTSALTNKNSYQFEYIIKQISHFAAEIENRRNQFQKLKEEEIRDNMLPSLSTIFKGRVNGEAKNCFGKTDILIKSKNGKNEFIFELKMWGGIDSLKNAIEQISKYTSWSNGHGGIIMFSKNKNFSKIIEETQNYLKETYDSVYIDSENECELRFKMPYKTDEYKFISLNLSFINLV